MTTASPARRLFGRLELSLVLAALAAWVIARPYAGLVHDARLYALQAMGRLHPESLGQDLFLRFGSQDAYSIFGGVYAAFIDLLGVEEAARWLTLAGHLWWALAAGWLSVRLLGREKGLLALAIIAGLPGFYGAWEVFRYAEPFLTARLFAEAAVLSGIALLVSGHRVGSAFAMVLAMSIHPLMGLAGVLLWAAAAIPGKLRWVVPVTVLGGTAMAVLTAYALPHFPLQTFDPEWLRYARLRSPFLFLSDWNADSFRMTLLPLLALWALPDRKAPAHGGRLFSATLLVGVLGLVVTLVGADMTHVVLITQGQAWRWTWISAVLVVVAAVRYAPGRWRSGGAGQAGLLLLWVGWILAGWPALAVAAAGALLLRIGPFLPPRGQRIAFLFSVAATFTGVGAAVTSMLADESLLQRFQEAGHLGASMQGLALGGFLITFLTLLIYWTSQQSRFNLLGPSLAAGLALLSLASTAPRLSAEQFRAAEPDPVETWKSVIPPDAEVFWPENPVGCWILLERRSFVSSLQTSGILFSPAAFRETMQRVDEVSAILPAAFALRAATEGAVWAPNSRTVAETCQASAVDFVVTNSDVGLPESAPPIEYKDEFLNEPRSAHLYRCPDFRSTGTPSDPRPGTPR